MSYDLHKQYLATHKDKLEQHITDVNIPKSEAEWWACDEITRLRAENEKLRKALAPFAANAKHFKDDCKDTLVVPIGVDVGYLRAAAAAIRDSGNE